MSIPFLVVLILNVLLAIFLLYGFLWGIGRGLKKSAIRFAYFIGFVIIAAIAAPFISSALAGIYIAPLNGSVEDFIVAQILSVQEIADLYNSSVAMQDLIAKLPVLLINIIVFVVLVYVSRIFSWIGYAITSKILSKKKKPVGKFGDKMYTVKDGQPVVLKKVEEKKHRWWGGLIGATQGLVLLFLTLLPLTGIVGMASSYINQTVSAESNNTVNAVVEEPEYTELAKLLREYLPADALEVIDAYSSSVVVKIFGVGNFDLACFDSLTTINVNGQRVGLRSEVNSVGEVVENVLYVKNFAEQMQNAESEQNWEDLDFNKMKKAVEAMFDSGLVRSVGMDALMYYLDYATGETNPFGLPDEAIQMLVAIQTSLEGDVDVETADVLKSDILALLGVAQAVFESGIIDLVDSDIEPTPAQIIACLKGTDGEYQVVYDFFDSLFTSKTLKAALCEGINIGTGEFGNMLRNRLTEQNGGNGTGQEVEFAQIQPNLVIWTNVKNEIVDSIIKGIEIYEIVGDLDFDTADETTILALEYDKVITNVGAILNNLKNTSILSGTVDGDSILDQIFENLNRLEEVGTYFDLTKLSDVDFVEEFAPIVILIDMAKPYILGTETDYSLLNYTYDSTDSDPDISTTIQSLLNSTFLEAIKTTVLDKVLESGIEGDMAETVEKIILNLQGDYDNLSEASAELMNFVNIACVFGESGAFDLINSSTDDDINAVINKLIEIKSGEETQIAKVIGYLFNSESTQILFVDAINQSLASMEEVENEMGRINKDQDWTGWATFSADLKTIVAHLIAIYGHLGGTADFDLIFSNPTTIVSNSNFTDIMSRLGQILDKFATTDLLDYSTGSIYDNLLTKMFSGELSEFISITSATTDEYEADYWKTEFENLAPAIARMNAIIIGDGESAKPLLELLIEGGEGFDSAIADLSNADVDLIFGALLDSSLLKPKAVGFVNMINETLIGIVQEDTSTVIAPATLTTDLKAQKNEILAVVKALLPIMDFTSIDDLFVSANETIIVAFLENLQANSNAVNGVFGSAYTIIGDYLTDTESTNQIAIDICYVLENDVDDVLGTTLATYDWAAIFTAINNLVG